jgi:cyanophycin synthetase
MKVPADVIRARAETFAADMDKVPARFNVLEIHGATVIVDYGHNTDALAALIRAMERFPHQRRTAVYTTAGDRRDCDMIRQGELLGEAFDRVILYEDHYLRGRPEGQIISLFRQGVEKGKRTKQIDVIHGADAAVELALRSAQPGDLMLVQADTVDETVQFIRRYLESIAEPAIAAELTAVEQEAAKKTTKPTEEAKRKPAATDTVGANVIPTPSTVAKL